VIAECVASVGFCASCDLVTIYLFQLVYDDFDFDKKLYK